MKSKKTVHFVFISIFFILLQNRMAAQTILYQDSFETNFGNWENIIGSGKGAWSRYTGSTPSANTGPDSASDGSYYLYIDGIAHCNYQYSGLQSPVIDFSLYEGMKIEFDYHMYGQDVNSLIVLYTDGVNPSVQLLKITGNKGNQWLHGSVDLSAVTAGNYRLNFWGLGSSGIKSDIGLDNIKVTYANLKAPPVTPAPISLWQDSFEEDYGNWINTDGDDSDFKRYKNDGFQPVLCPENANGGDYYLYFDGTKNYPNKSAVLISGKINFSKLKDLRISFYYYIHGQDKGELDLMTATGSIIWSVKEDQGSGWNYADLPLNFLSSIGYLKFKASTADSKNIGIALDNIKITYSECTDPDAIISRIKITDTDIENKIIISKETFESGQNIWKNYLVENPSNNYDFKWVCNREDTPVVNSGPDLAAEGNYYVYLQCNLYGSSNYSKLEGPTINFDEYKGEIITFWHHIYGASINSLELIFTSETAGFISLWKQNGSTGNEWQKAVIDLSGLQGKGRLSFISDNNTGIYCNIALDNIKIYCDPLKNECSVWSVNGTDAYFDKGNVGIGVTKPAEKLEVAGTIKAEKFFGDGSNLTNNWSWQKSGNNIYYLNNVAIGTNASEEKLIVSGKSKFTDLIVGGINPYLDNSTFNIWAQQKRENWDNTPVILGTLGAKALQSNGIINEAAAKIDFIRQPLMNGGQSGSQIDFTTGYTGDNLSYQAVAMSINPKGNVSIGTDDSAEYKLNVGGDINFTGTLYKNGVPFVSNAWLANGSNIYFNSTGNIGINTMNPTEKLSVNGTIAAAAIKIRLPADNSTAAWPDYVFSPEFYTKMMTLEETEVYIREHKHLPGMPGAKEIGEKGSIDLAEMNVKLLEQIEKLTLQLIEVKKDLNDVRSELKSMKNTLGE